jgi:hypothetical protein
LTESHWPEFNAATIDNIFLLIPGLSISNFSADIWTDLKRPLIRHVDQGSIGEVSLHVNRLNRANCLIKNVTEGGDKIGGVQILTYLLKAG